VGRRLGLAVLFGAGLAATLTAWGVLIALIGGFLPFREAARYLSIAGGAVCYTLGLWTLGLVRFRLPAGSAQLPRALRNRSDYVQTFALGLLLGNMGMCCPDPVFLSLIPFLAASGDVVSGGSLAAAYGLGRATPLVAMVALTSYGVDALQLAVRHKERFDRALGWGLVATGTFMLVGYSGITRVELAAVLLMTAPALVFHVRSRSSLVRTGAWMAATAGATVLGLRLILFMLVNLP
jgi:cytochrome c-type biogenesis protein